MRSQLIEAWALQIVDRVRARHPVEDARVEIKAEWPEPVKSARRIAGHANAAGGEPILWIIGLDEKTGSVLPAVPDLANAWPPIQMCFEGVAPEIRDVRVPVDGGSVLALLIETGRAPFVIKNPAYGGSGETVQLEVPWRSGTSVRSARREDLVRLLVPQTRLPSIEVLHGRALWNTPKQQAPSVDVGYWQVGLDLYITPRDSERLVFPVHRTLLRWRHEANDLHWETSEVSFRRLRLTPAGQAFDRLNSASSQTTTATDSEVIVTGPGVVNVSARLNSDRSGVRPDNLDLEVLLQPAGSDLIAAAGLTLVPAANSASGSAKWSPDGAAVL